MTESIESNSIAVYLAFWWGRIGLRLSIRIRAPNNAGQHHDIFVESDLPAFVVDREGDVGERLEPRAGAKRRYEVPVPQKNNSKIRLS